MLAMRHFLKGLSSLLSLPFGMKEARQTAAEPAPEPASEVGPEPSQSVEPMLCGRYRIVSVLGEGGGGKVFAAEDMETRASVAIKITDPHEPERSSSLTREYYVLCDLHRALCDAGQPAVAPAVFKHGRVKNAEILPWALWHEIPPSSPLPDKLEVSHISVTRRDLAASDAPLEHAAWSQLASLKPTEALQSRSTHAAESHATPPLLVVPRGTNAAPAPWPLKQSSKQVAHSTSPPAADLLDQHHAPTQHAFFPESLQHSAPQVPPPLKTHHAANVVTSADGSLDAACSLSSAASFDTSDVSETSASSGPGCTEDMLLLAAARKRTDTCASAQRCSCDTVEVSAARAEQRRAASEASADSGGREAATSGGTQVKPRPDPNAECEFVVMELLGSSLSTVAQRKRGVRGLRLTQAGRAMSVDTGRLAFDDWLALCTLMADALEAVHMAGFVHGDVKTENFCVTLDAHGHYESVALVDYGFAGRVEKLRDNKSTFLGTPDYASRGQLQCRTATPADDVECLAYCFLELYLGDLPWMHDAGSAALFAAGVKLSVQGIGACAPPKSHLVDVAVYQRLAHRRQSVLQACRQGGLEPAFIHRIICEAWIAQASAQRRLEERCERGPHLDMTIYNSVHEGLAAFAAEWCAAEEPPEIDLGPLLRLLARPRAAPRSSQCRESPSPRGHRGDSVVDMDELDVEPLACGAPMAYASDVDDLALEAECARGTSTTLGKRGPAQLGGELEGGKRPRLLMRGADMLAEE